MCKNYNDITAETCSACGKPRPAHIVPPPPAAQTNNNTSSDDVIESIKKYKNLFDEGYITEEEFIAKKQQLLSK